MDVNNWSRFTLLARLLQRNGWHIEASIPSSKNGFILQGKRVDWIIELQVDEGLSDEVVLVEQLTEAMIRFRTSKEFIVLAQMSNEEIREVWNSRRKSRGKEDKNG